ncbi:maleylpyruvate isomerase family mycothiol-dependent enzyme [Nocardioides sp. zg-1228]|uniref:maleylpyruvate isomerase family mycothiol-dependent enzyme n=1 Tax=Nocardioides sp. zg-1228 TaxID=2763008 RepID=UPI00164346FD|nr:maleylpyruvate isomerase family mycothiol-dependent enzyme [Nocardioides sp. zg-1228]MBC2934606.1 maleylpyruvate isomerase family mycothiol-dependent enzyme [Nocardioides sp. zg-1228]QSF59354.1 maleylpyruvate isomerase family mycothiol-dependent enzyme [Nocardioides sp. zg-1228]
MTTDSALLDLLRTERGALIDTLRALDDARWQVPSLCAGWRVVDVAAHLAWAPVLGPGAAAAALARHGFSINRMIERSAVEWSGRGHKAILDRLERNLADDARPAGMPVVAALADAVVHGLDVRRPLGLPHAVPPEALAPVADFALRTPWPLTAVVGGSARRRVAGVRLVAEDAGWSHGSGPEVRTSAEAVLLLLHGRAPAPAELSGPGASVVLARL